MELCGAVRGTRQNKVQEFEESSTRCNRNRGGDRKLKGIIDIKKRKTGKKLRKIQPVSNELMDAKDPPPDEAVAQRVGVHQPE